MKRPAIAVAVLATSAALVSACTGSDSGTAASSPAPSPSRTCCAAPASPSDARGPQYVSAPQRIVGRDPVLPISWDVTLPQVTGGDAAPRERFNQSIRAALDDEIAGMRDGAPYSRGTLTDTFLGDETDTGRVARISPHLIAGVTVYMRTFINTPHPIILVATAVTDIATAQPITVDDMYTDPVTAPANVLALARAIDTSKRLDDDQSVEEDEIANWVPLQSGLLVYFPVLHVLGDYVPVTIPWDQVAPLLKPGMLQMLSG